MTEWDPGKRWVRTGCKWHHRWSSWTAACSVCSQSVAVVETVVWLYTGWLVCGGVVVVPWACSGLPSCLFTGLLSKCHCRLLWWCVFTRCQWFPNTLSGAITEWPQRVCVSVLRVVPNGTWVNCPFVKINKRKPNKLTGWPLSSNGVELQLRIIFIID